VKERLEQRKDAHVKEGKTSKRLVKPTSGSRGEDTQSSNPEKFYPLQCITTHHNKLSDLETQKGASSTALTERKEI